MMSGTDYNYVSMLNGLVMKARRPEKEASAAVDFNGGSDIVGC